MLRTLLYQAVGTSFINIDWNNEKRRIWTTGSKPEIIVKEIDGKKCEPFEDVQIDVNEENVGPVIEALGLVWGNE